MGWGCWAKPKLVAVEPPTAGASLPPPPARSSFSKVVATAESDLSADSSIPRNRADSGSRSVSFSAVGLGKSDSPKRGSVLATDAASVIALSIALSRGDSFPLRVNESMTVRELHVLVAKMTESLPVEVRLLCGPKALNDGSVRLRDATKSCTTIHVVRTYAEVCSGSDSCSDSS